MKLSHNLTQAIYQCWNAIAYDVFQLPGDDPLDAFGAIEVCLDADRLEFCADNPEANQEMKALVKQHGWTNVVTEISNQIKLV